MAIDIDTEPLLTIAQAAKQCPGKPHIATVWRWILKGLNGIVLESVKVGGRRFTSQDAIRRFIAAQTKGCDQIQGQRSCVQRERDIDNAERTLRDFGV